MLFDICVEQFKFISVFKTWFQSVGMLFLLNNNKELYGLKKCDNEEMQRLGYAIYRCLFIEIKKKETTYFFK